MLFLKKERTSDSEAESAVMLESKCVVEFAEVSEFLYFAHKAIEHT